MPAERSGVDELLSELGRMHSELASQQRLSAITAHDLSGPTQVIVGLTEVLLDSSDLLPEVRRHLENVQRSAQTLVALISDLGRGLGLDDPTHLHFERVNLADLARSVGERTRVLADTEGIVLTSITDDARSGCWVAADAVKLERALVNVLGNAIKFSPHGGVVTVSVAHSGELAWVNVSDQGPGVSPKGRERIFDAFHREEHTAHVPGTGLGLFITRQILESHGGSIAIEPRPGPGTTFVLRLPRA